MVPSHAEIESAFERHERLLWGLAYRLTGVAADADDVVQETFARAIERPPGRVDDNWHRWLVRVATNLGLDQLRARRRRSESASWLPAPLEDIERAAPAEDATEARYERVESLTYAFLLALEALRPRERAVLLLRDVFDHSAAEVAATLDTSEANIRVLHHRARRRMADYDRRRCLPNRELADRTKTVLERLVAGLARGDEDAIAALMAESVRTVTDGGGRYTALRSPLVGRKRVLRFHLETARRRAPISRFEIREVNGLPALFIRTAPKRAQMAPRVVLRFELDEEGRIVELHSILDPRKLTAVSFDGEM